jgi:hypothetical protein
VKKRKGQRMSGERKKEAGQQMKECTFGCQQGQHQGQKQTEYGVQELHNKPQDN